MNSIYKQILLLPKIVKYLISKRTANFLPCSTLILKHSNKEPRVMVDFSSKKINHCFSSKVFSSICCWRNELIHF